MKIMDPKFNKERRDVLKGTCGFVGVAAVMSVGASVPAYADVQKDARRWAMCLYSPTARRRAVW